MSVSKRILFAISVSWIGRTVGILSTLVLLPIFFRYLDNETLGVWMVIYAGAPFFNVLNFGIGPTLSRRLSFAKGLSGSDPKAAMTEESRENIADLIATGRRVLRWLSIFAFLFALGAGFFILGKVEAPNITFQTIIIAWTIMCVGHGVNVYVSYLDYSINGLGEVGWGTIVGTITSLLLFVANILIVMNISGGEVIIWLACAYVGQNWLKRVGLILVARKRARELIDLTGKWNEGLARDMFKPALFFWLTSVGSFLIQRTDSFFISIFKGAALLPPYQAAWTVIFNLALICYSLNAPAVTFISMAWRANKLGEVHNLALRQTGAAMAIIGGGVAFLLVSGPLFFNLWLGEGNFVGYPVLILFLVMFTLQVNATSMSSCARATEDEKYVMSTLIAGILNLVLTWLLIGSLGLPGVALATLGAQLVTNLWYMPYRALKRLQIPFVVYARKILLIWLITIVAATGLAFVVTQYLLPALEIENPYIIAFSSFMICGLTIVVVILRVVLNKSQRGQLLRWILETIYRRPAMN